MALFSAWADANPASLVILQAQAEDGTRVYVQARLTENGSPVAGAVVTASLRAADGTASALRLFDDGQHDDEEAGDGVYGGRSADNLARGDYFVEVTSNAAGATGFVSFPR